VIATFQRHSLIVERGDRSLSALRVIRYRCPGLAAALTFTISNFSDKISRCTLRHRPKTPDPTLPDSDLTNGRRRFAHSPGLRWSVLSCGFAANRRYKGSTRWQAIS
jgi:hypothetical protein